MMKALALVSLLCWVNTAIAGSAWVLWRKEYHGSNPNNATKQWGTETLHWNVLSASTNEADCQRKLQDAMERAQDPKKIPKDQEWWHSVEDTTISRAVFPKNAKDTDTIIERHVLRYICLPETVDPRVPRR